MYFTCGILLIWTVIGLKESLSCQFSYLPGVLARLTMHHTRVFGVGILNDAYWVFKDASFGPPSNLNACISLVEFY